MCMYNKLLLNYKNMTVQNSMYLGCLQPLKVKVRGSHLNVKEI